MISANSNFSIPASHGLLSDAWCDRLRAAYAESLPLSPALEPTLADVLAYVADRPGGLVRAQLAFGMLAAMQPEQEEAALRIAIAVEYFHTASLILDDLPCMDDAAERRGFPCAHVEFGEAAAILGALGFINRAYALMWQGIRMSGCSDPERATAVLEECLGASGILHGQSLDLHAMRSRQSAEAIQEVADGKTGTLLKLCMVLPGIVGGASDAACVVLSETAHLWGRVYQLLDDLKDCLLTAAESGKTAGRDVDLDRPNLVLALGLQPSLVQLDDFLQASARLLQGLPEVVGIPVLHALQARFEAQANLLRLRLEGQACAV